MATSTTTTIRTESPSPAERRRMLEEAKRKRMARAFWDPSYYADPRNADAARSITPPGVDQLTEAQFNRQQIAAQGSMISPNMVNKMIEVLSASPTVSPGVATSLAQFADQAQFSDEIQEDILTLDAEARALEADVTGGREPDQGSEAQKGGFLSRAFGEITRPLFALASLPVEAIQGGMRNLVGMATGGESHDAQADIFQAAVPGPGGFAAQAIAQTTGGQYLAGLGTDLSADMGTGWIPNGEVEGRAEAVKRNTAPLVFNDHWTLGRGVGSMIYDNPDNLAYQNLSGLIDMSAAILTDPFIFTGVGAAAGAGVRAGARGAAAQRLGSRTGQTGIEREAAEILTGTERALAQAERLSQKTLEVANLHVRGAANAYVTAERGAARVKATRPLEDIDRHLDHLDDELRMAQLDLATASKGRRFELPEEAVAADVDMKVAIDDLTMALGDDGLDAMQAKVLADSPELPGAFTDAVFVARSRKDNLPNALPGADTGTDAVVLYTSEKAPVLRSVDDQVDVGDQLLAAVKGASKQSNRRKRSLRGLTELLTTPRVTYTDVLRFAEQNDLGTAIQAGLRNSGIDGITDVFRLTGGEGGVWWTGRNVQVARWSDEVGAPSVDPLARAPKETYRVRDETVDGHKERIAALREQRKQVAAERKGRAKRATQQERFLNTLADTYDKAMKTRTAAAGTQESVRQSLEYAVGVRRTLGGTPERSHELLRQWLVGPTRDFDEAINATAAVPGALQAAEDINRGLVALTTLGASEVARGVGRLVQPFATRAREAALGALVKLDDSPKNLGLVQRLTNGKIEPEILKAALRAQTEDEVLEVLGPAVGVGITRPIGPNSINAAPVRINGLYGGRANYTLLEKGQRFITDMAERASAVHPRFGAHINLADPQGAANVYRNYLNNLPGVQVEFIDDLVGDLLSQTTEVGRASSVMKGMDRVGDALVDYNANLKGPLKLSDETQQILKDSLRRTTRIFAGGRAEVNNWWLKQYAADANQGFHTVDGQLIPHVGPQLEAELARGGMILPDMTEISRSIGRWGAAIQKHPFLKGSLDFIDWGMDLWRSSILFRLAYTVRNIGEMQFRMFLSGHSSIYNDPMGSLAMASAMNKRTATSRGLMGRFAKYNKTATGKTLDPVGTDDLNATENSLEEHIELMNRTGSFHDQRSVRGVEMNYNVAPVRVDQPGFEKGWAEQLMLLRSDRVARIVAGQDPKPVAQMVAKGVDREDAIVDWILHHKGAAGIRSEYAEASPNLARIFSDPQAVREFLFDSPYSIKARIQQYTGNGNTDLVNFLRTGILNRNGQKVFNVGTREVTDAEARQQMMATRVQRLAGPLRQFKENLPEDFKLNMRVAVSQRNTPEAVTNRVFNWFFDWNGRKERAWAQGPEFSYAFNDAMVQLMPALNPADRAKVFDFVKSAEKRFRPNSETLIKAKAAMKHEAGDLTMEDAERVAARAASEHVKKLFYDAQQRRNVFHQLRLVMPFAQPFADTLWRWGRLAAARPYMIEKFGRLGEALTEEGSGVIYDDFDWIDPFTERQSRDPTQGFIFKDPTTGESRFAFPLIGSALGAVLSPAAGFNVAESMQLTAPVQNLNLAFQGDVDYLPGVGPLVSFPAAAVMPDDAFGAFPEWLRDYMFPYGEPDPEGGLVESTFFPSWLRRMTGAAYNDQFRAYSYKGVMAYMASTKEYPGIRESPEVQQQLMDDVQGGARVLTFIRALGAAILPAAPTQEIYAADKDGRLIGSAYMADHYHQTLKETGFDYEAATKSFIDSYGMQALAAIVPASEGEFTISGPGFEWYKKHPEEGKAFSDVLGYFFPGDFSYDAYAFQTESEDRVGLSIEERTERMVQFMYNAEKTQMEGRAARDMWDVNQIEEAEEELRTRYGGVIPSFSGVDSRTRLDQIRRAIDQFPDLAATRGGEGAQLLFEAHEEYEEMAQERFGSGLASERAEGYREEFLNEVDSIVAEYGGQNLEDGSVTNIANLFVNVVTPRS